MAGCEYFLEILTADLPPRAARRAQRAFVTSLFEELMGFGLGPREVRVGWTIRRMAVGLLGLPEVEPEGEETLIGPAESEAYGPKGRPNAKLRAFAKKAGVRPKETTKVRTERGVYLAVVRPRACRSTREVLARILPRLLAEAPWPERMAWSGEGSWSRPIRSLVSLFDGKVLALELCGVRAGGETRGHPVHSPEPFVVRGFADYRRQLAERGVEITFEARRAALAEALEGWAEEEGGEPSGGGGLLDRLAGRTEVPNLLCGSLGAAFRNLPEEVVLATLEERLQAFVLRQGDTLAGRFATVVDRPGEPGPAIVRGFELAAAGELADSAFHLEADRRRPLAEQRQRLRAIDVHPRLGSFAAKSERLRELAPWICRELGWEEAADLAAEAAALAKTDLAAATVRHLPRMRGVLGGILAREEGHVEALWQGIYDHALPRRPADPIPRGRVGQALSVADRLDTLVGMFGIGEVPSGSRDPHALRRLARGLVRILIEAEMDLDLDLIAARALLLYPGDGEAGGEAAAGVFEEPAEAVLARLGPFLLRRLRAWLGEAGFAFDEIEAAIAAGVGSLPEVAARVEALAEVRREEGFAALVLAGKRIDKMLAGSPEHQLRPELLEAGAERELGRRVEEVRAAVTENLGRARHSEALRSMMPLAEVLDRFFTEVLVMDEDPERRANRLALLQSTRRVFWRVARLKELAIGTPAESASASTGEAVEEI